MQPVLKEIKTFFRNHVVIFWCLSVFFILSFIVTITAVLLLPAAYEVKLMQECILSVVITFSGIIFLRNWLKAYKKNEEIYKTKDYGLAWLAGAMLCWSFFICLDLLLPSQVKYLGPVFSALNSFCFLFAIPYFDAVKQETKLPKIFLKLGINSGKYKSIVFWYVVIVLFIIIAISAVADQPLSLRGGTIKLFWSGIVDAVCLGFPTLLILSVTLYQTWISRIRRDRWMVALTIIVLSFTLVMQFVNAWDRGDTYPVAYAISGVLYRVLLIMLFYGIAFSWTYSMLVAQNEELNKAQTEIEFAHTNMKHGILNNVLILKIDLDNMLAALKNVSNVQGKEESVKEVTEIFNRYDFLLQMAGLLYNPVEEYSDTIFFTKLLDLVKKVLHLTDEEFTYKIDIDGPVTKSASQQRDFGIIAYELITNAKKYGSGETVKIEVEIIGKKPEITFKVKDRGDKFFDVESAIRAGQLRGLKSVLGRIKFYQGNYFTRENFPGTIFVVELPV